MRYVVLERECLEVVAGAESELVVVVVEVGVAVRRGLELLLDSDARLVSEDCLIWVLVDYPGRRLITGEPDGDVLVTDGQRWWLARRTLGRSPLRFTAAVAGVLGAAVSGFFTGG